MGFSTGVKRVITWLVFALLSQPLVLIPTAAHAVVLPNAATNTTNGVCDFVNGTAQGVDRSTSNSGTQQNPFGLFSTSDFVELRICVNTNTNSLSGKVFAVGNDIDFSGVPLIPIGTNATGANRFSGTVIGNGYTLSKIKVVTSGSTFGSGLFGVTQGATFRDLVISGEVLGVGAAGLLVGYAALTGTFSNIVAYSSVSAAAPLDMSQYKQVGGLIGVSRGDSANSSGCSPTNLTITNVTVDPLDGTGRVFGYGSSHGQTAAAGLVGQAMCTTITNARTSMDVTYQGRGSAGGLLGISSGKTRIINSVAFGDVTSNETTFSTSWNDVNTFAGYYDFYNSSGTAGGFVGMTAKDDSYSDTHAFGNVNLHNGFGGGYAGVFFDAVASDSGASGDVYASSRSYIGGFAGYSYVFNASSISRGYAFGNVFGNETIYAGGFLGAYANGYAGMTISDSIARGKVSISSTVATSAAAGFIGAVKGSGNLSRNIAYSSASTSAALNRGFIGRAFSTSWNRSNNFRLDVAGLADASTGNWSTTLSSTSMSQIGTFANFDIGSFSTGRSGSIWMMCADAPVLRSSKYASDCPVVPRWHEVAQDGRTVRVFYPGPVVAVGANSSLVVNGQAVVSQATASQELLIATLSASVAKDAALAVNFAFDNAQPHQVQRLTDNSPIGVSSYTGYPGINLSMVPGPSVAAISLNRGYFNLNNAVALSGTNLSGAILQVDGITISPTSNTDTSIVFTLPAGSAGTTASIVITNNLGSYTLNNAFFRIPAPLLTSASPSTTSAAGGAVMELQGQYFSGSTQVNVNGQSVAFTLLSDTRITFSSPAGTPGTTASVTVTSPAGTSNPLAAFYFNPLPTIIGLSVTGSSLAGGANLTLLGSGFATAATLSFGSMPTISFTILSDSQIQFTVPSSNSAGVVAINVVTANGSVSLQSAFTYLPAPTLFTNSPTLATTLGGSIVSLTGTGLASTQRVFIGTQTVSFAVVSDTVLRVSTSAIAAGSYNIWIQTPGGAATLSQALTFTSSSIAPVITSMTPISGSIAGGYLITILGRFFSGSYSAPLTVAINGVTASGVSVLDDGTVTLIAPAGVVGNFLDVVVTTGGGSASLIGAFSYLGNQTGSARNDSTPTSPMIFSISSRVVVSTTKSLTISGVNLANVSELHVGGIAVSISANTDSTVNFVLPKLAIGTWNLVLVNSLGSLTYLRAITVIAESEVPLQRPGMLVAWRFLPSFKANLKALSNTQHQAIINLAKQFENSRAAICWGYTSKYASNQANAASSARAKMVCDALASKLGVNVSVRLRNAPSASHINKVAIQFWK